MQHSIRWFAFLLAFAALVAAPQRADATTHWPQEVKCPVCTTGFTAWVIGSYNTFGGVDSDLCSHSAGGSPLEVWVWTCPHCRYSKPLEDFEKGVTPEVAEWIRAGLEPGEPIASDQSQLRIPAWVKYGLALRVMEKEGADRLKLARVRLAGVRASRCGARDEADLSWALSDDPSAVKGDQPWTRFAAHRAADSDSSPDRKNLSTDDVRGARRLLAETPPEGVAPAEWRLLGAEVLRNRGEYAESRPVLERIAADPSASEFARKRAAGVLASLLREAALYEAWLADADAVAAAEDHRASAAVVRWVAADARRRLGMADAFRASLPAVMEDPAIPAWCFDLARRVARDAGFAPFTPAREAELWTGRIAALGAQLLDPSEAGDAWQSARALRDPGLRPYALAALLSDEPAVQEAGIRLSGLWGDPAPAIVRRICDIMLETTSEGTRSAAVRALEDIGSTVAAEALAEALGYSSRTAQEAVDALGMCGDEASVDPLLAVRQAHGRDVARTLSIITNTPERGEAEFAEWWTKHGGEMRDTWIRAGFVAEGLAVPAGEFSAADVPALVGWLSHEKRHIRANALRVLRPLTGQSFGWDVLRRDYEKARPERMHAVEQWMAWLAGRK